MRITVLGATGMAGAAVVTEALSRGHAVLGTSRRGDLTPRAGLDVRALDVTDPAAVEAALAPADVAVLSVRFPPGEEHRIASATSGVLDAAARTGTRVLVVGGSAPLRSPNGRDLLVLDDPALVPEAWRNIARASLDQFHACERHHHRGWTYLSPPAVFEPGPRTGSYRRGTTTLLLDADGASRISPADLAIAVLDEIETPGPDRHITAVGPGTSS